MNARTRSALQGLVGLMLAVGWSGCPIITDVFNPSLAEQLGLDPAILQSPKGTVLVAFRNTTRFPAVFSAFRSLNASDLSRGTRNFTVPVDASSVGNEVLDCPVEIISPGSVGQNLAIQSVAATVQADTATVQVNYDGQPLLVGRTFTCGDVVEIMLSAVAGAGQAGTSAQDYVVTVRIIPGR